MGLKTSLWVVVCLALVGCGEATSTEAECITACHPREPELAWKALPTEGAPEARRLHASVWTGREMLVWGGMLPKAGTLAGDGAAYDPNTDTWRPMSTTGAPSPRHSHRAVWTGSKMLVWGGFEAGGYALRGGAYDPETDTWSEIPEPPIGGRTRHSAAWTGTEFVIWGGLDAAGPLGDGARFDLAKSSWEKLPSDGPSARASHVGVWTGSELLVWGGTDTFDWFSDGRHLDVGTATWGATIADTGAPSLREGATGLWTGNELLVWGGWNGGDYLPDGALYEPAAKTWSSMTGSGPVGRANHVSIWTGDELFVWGGCTDDSCMTLLANGGRYTKSDGWVTINSSAELSARVGATGVFTGTEVIVFGGSDGSFKPIAGGARAKL